MKKYDSRLVGIFGAISIHLIAGIVFMLVKIGELNIREYAREYEITLEDISEADQRDIQSLVEATSIEQILRDDPELMNIARNLAARPDIKINAEDYIDMVKEELIKSGKLGPDNYIDEWKRLKEDSEESRLSLEDTEKVTDDDIPKDSQELASRYSGPTRIYYNLPGRTHTRLPIPIYKCEGSGKVTLAIEVNQRGYVEDASIIDSESSTNDPCLIETAISAALASRFTPDINAEKTQEGTLTYHFVAQ